MKPEEYMELMQLWHGSDRM